MSTGTVLPLAGSLLVLGMALLGLAAMIGAGSLDRNGAVGIRTRATRASDRAWAAGHRAAQGVLRATGRCCLVCAVLAAAVALAVPGRSAGPIGMVVVGAGYVALTLGLVVVVRRADTAARSS